MGRAEVMDNIIFTKKCILFPLDPKDLDLFVTLIQENEHEIELFKGIKLEELKQIIWDRVKNGIMRIWLATTKQGKGSRPIGFLYLTNILPYRANVHGMISKVFLKDLVKELETRYTYTEDCYTGFIDWCFNNLNIERLETIIKRDNGLAYRIDKKVGFKTEGVLKSYIKEEDGTYSDIVVMAILKNERLQSNSAIPSDKVEQPIKR